MMNMATTTLSPEHLIPLQISGNTTDAQAQQLEEVLLEAGRDACRLSLEQMDRQSARAVLEESHRLRAAVSERVVEIVRRSARSDLFKDEEVVSQRRYPPTYKPRPVEAQVTELRKIFPGLGSCGEKLARKPLPEGAEAWFAVPRWQEIAPTYSEAVERMLEAFAKRRKLSNRIVGKLGEKYLRQTDRAQHAKEMLGEQQPGHSILVAAAQMGMLHRGSSARRTRAVRPGMNTAWEYLRSDAFCSRIRNACPARKHS
jgi:hypothetical protein